MAGRNLWIDLFIDSQMANGMNCRKEGGRRERKGTKGRRDEEMEGREEGRNGGNKKLRPPDWLPDKASRDRALELTGVIPGISPD